MSIHTYIPFQWQICSTFLWFVVFKMKMWMQWCNVDPIVDLLVVKTILSTQVLALMHPKSTSSLQCCNLSQKREYIQLEFKACWIETMSGFNSFQGPNWKEWFGHLYTEMVSCNNINFAFSILKASLTVTVLIVARSYLKGLSAIRKIFKSL